MRLMLGDCLELMKDIPDNSVDMVMCDLPYGTTQNKWDSIIPFDPLWKEYNRICNGAVVLTSSQPFTSVLITSNIKNFKCEWIWEKGVATGFLNSQKQPLRAHENICVFYNKQCTYNPIKTYNHEKKTATSANNSSNYGKHKNVKYSSTERYPRDVLFFSGGSQSLKVHPTQKPVALMEYMIRTYTNECDTVLDNCMGSGTTGIACINSNRKFIGIEKDKKYFNAAQERINFALQSRLV